MHGVVAKGFCRLAFAVIIVGAIVGSMSRADAASVEVSWTAPTTNADGTPLRDLAGYRRGGPTLLPGDAACDDCHASVR